MKLPSQLRWVEVDFPNMIDLKNQKLAAEKPVCRLERIALDLSVASLRKELFARLGAETKKALIITEGVIHYLSNDDAAALAQDLRSTPSFQCWIQDYLNDHKRRSRRRWDKKLQAAPFKFSVPDWFKFFAKLGWVELERRSHADEIRRTRRFPPFPLFWKFLWVVTPASKRENFRKISGCVLLQRS